MTYIPLGAGVTLLLIIFVLSEASWNNFSTTFPQLREATAGPYFVILSSIVLTLALRNTFIGSSKEKYDRFPVTGAQVASIVSLLSAFVYSFSLINSSIPIKYFLLLQLLTYVIFYGGAQFFGDIKFLDKSKTSQRVRQNQLEFDLKKLALEIKQQSRDEITSRPIEVLLLQLKDCDLSLKGGLLDNAKALLEVIREDKNLIREFKQLELLIDRMEQK